MKTSIYKDFKAFCCIYDNYYYVILKLQTLGVSVMIPFFVNA